MCTVSGFVPYKEQSVNQEKLQFLFTRAVDRGRDSFGLAHANQSTIQTRKQTTAYSPQQIFRDLDLTTKSIIANHRAEPTSEFVREKTVEDVQPFIFQTADCQCGVVHNGIIANDRELAAEFPATAVPAPTNIDTQVAFSSLFRSLKPGSYSGDSLENLAQHIIKKVQGSYAIAVLEKNRVLLICNYKPIYFNFQPEGVYFASQKEYLQFHGLFSPLDNIKKMPSYSYCILDSAQEKINLEFKEFRSPLKEKALVICSGGLDSTVALQIAVNRFSSKNVSLLHFLYNCRAQKREIEAVKNIAQKLNLETIFLPIDIFGKMITESPLLNDRAEIQKFDKGIEYAHEWVPARNLIMLSLATAYAEAKGFGYLYLGNNLEESGAYPDNEMEFISQFQAILPNAVADGVNLQVEQPVGNLMKHEIVKLGVAIAAPLELTWSCYEAGTLHCGQCGPCQMRRRAFEMNNYSDSLAYLK